MFFQAALCSLKNGPGLVDYLRLLVLCGAHEQETIKFEVGKRKLLTIGADGDTKNWEARRVDFNAELEIHLQAMHSQCAPDT
jgi:hypothetical protein